MVDRSESWLTQDRANWFDRSESWLTRDRANWFDRFPSIDQNSSMLIFLRKVIRWTDLPIQSIGQKGLILNIENQLVTDYTFNWWTSTLNHFTFYVFLIYDIIGHFDVVKWGDLHSSERLALNLIVHVSSTLHKIAQ